MRFPDLRSVFASFRWAVIGPAATRMYMPERATQDFDILVLATDYHAAEKSLLNAGFHQAGPLAVGGTSWTALDGFAVDVSICHEPWCEPRNL